MASFQSAPFYRWFRIFLSQIAASTYPSTVRMTGLKSALHKAWMTEQTQTSSSFFIDVCNGQWIEFHFAASFIFVKSNFICRHTCNFSDFKSLLLKLESINRAVVCRRKLIPNHFFLRIANCFLKKLLH